MKGINSSTWIDWQYLFVAASLLAKCRYTLKFTYPLAFYMPGSSRKDLFEYQQVKFPKTFGLAFMLKRFPQLQAQLEAEIENLSWKIERAETTERDRGDIENQMDIAEKRRMILLKDFFPDANAVTEAT